MKKHYMNQHSRWKNLSIVLSFAIISASHADAGLDDYVNAAYFDQFNPPPENFNPDYIGFDSGGNNNPNALQFSGGASVASVAMYDSNGNQLIKDGNLVVTEAADVGYYNGDHNGKIHAGAIAQIKINGTTTNCIYLSAVDLEGPGTHSGWVPVSAMSPSNTVWTLSQEVNARRETVRYTNNPGGISRYERMEAVSVEVPSAMENGYIIPNRTSNAGKVDYYYIRDGLINGFINLPETGNKRHGVQCSRVAPGNYFYRDMDVDNYVQNIYGYNSSNVIGTFNWCFGYFETNAGTKIYCWTNRDCLKSSTFTPDPDKKYYIDVPQHNLRIGASGEAEDPFTTSTSITGAQVEWKFVAKGNDTWHIQLAAGGSKPRLRSRNNGEPDMQATSSSGTWTYYTFTPGALANTFTVTLPDHNTNRNRLQVTSDGSIKFVPDTYLGSWESFRFTEVSSANIVHITKRNATNFAIDSGGTASDGKAVYIWNANPNNGNQQWEEIDRGGGFYSYQKAGTNFSLDGGGGGKNGQDVYLWSTGNNNYNQQWQKLSTGGGAYKLIKRNAAYAINGGSGGSNGQNVNLYNSSNSSYNLQWFVTPQ